MTDLSRQIDTLTQQIASARARFLLLVAVVIWVFSGAFVMVEPSPYEVFFLAALGLSVVTGMPLSKATLPLLGIILLFIPFSLIAAFQGKYLGLTNALLYTLVTIFLFITSYFVANFIAANPSRHFRAIMNAYILAAIITAAIGALAYLGILPGEEVFLRYGRAKALFKDPNVYGPFMMLPAAVLLTRACLAKPKEAFISALLYLVLFVGVFVSFSRGAWAHLLVTSGFVFVAIFILEARGKDQVRMLMLSVVGAMFLIVALAGLLSTDGVSDFFIQRFTMQSYDTGETGRFGRIGYGVELAISNPWGIGPLEFPYLKIRELPHNTYINMLHAYGWGGAFAFYVLVITSLVIGFKALATPSPMRVFLIPVLGTFVPMIVLSGIIDIDHWRHWFLVTGILWGCVAGYKSRINTIKGAERLLP